MRCTGTLLEIGERCCDEGFFRTFFMLGRMEVDNKNIRDGI